MATQYKNDIASLWAYAPQATRKGVSATSQYLTMHDGVKIAIDVILPADRDSEERLPCLMVMARYWRSMALIIPSPPNKAPIGPRENTIDYFVSVGFAVVVVDGRGSGASMGVSRHPWSPEEREDYAEVAGWIGQQTWSDGTIGAYGISYEGTTAMFLAGAGIKGIEGVIVQEVEFDIYTDVALPGGIFNEAFIKAWNASNQRLDNNRTSDLFPWLARLFIKGVRPVDEDAQRILLKQAVQEHQANTNIYEAMRHITYRDDEFGDTGATLDDFSLFKYQEAFEQDGVPLFMWGSWLDGTAAETVLATFNNLSNQQIGVIGAWKHEMTAHGSPYQRANAKPNPDKEIQWQAMTQFFQQSLGGEAPQDKRLYYYTLGEEVWKQTDLFPPREAQMQTWYLQEGHALSPQAPTSANGEDLYTVDFEATTGKTNRWHTPMARPLVYLNRAKADERLLTYTSAPITRPIEITGYPIVTLYIASTHADGAFFVYLEDVDEQGVVRYITEGQLRGIHRKLSSAPAPYISGMPYRTYARQDASPLPIGETVEMIIGLQPTSVLIERGHRLRIALAGADKDTFARIPTDGTPTWTLSRHSAYPSSIALPMIER